MSGTVTVDYPASARVAAMKIGGMTVIERILRDAARAGATRAVVRAEAGALPALPTLALAVELVGPGAALPADGRAIPGDVIAGVRVTDEASRRAAERALLETCRRPHDGVGDRYVIRSISLRFTRVFARLGLTPNQVTCANIVVGLTACAFAQRGTYAGFALGGVLMWLQVVLDSSDGELSRIRHLGSKFGMWLDNVSDDVIDNLFVVALGLGLGGVWAWVGIVAAALRGTCALMIYRDVGRRGKGGDVMAFRWWFDREDEELAERFEVKLTPMAVLRGLGRRDLYPLVWGVCCLAGVPLGALALGVAISVGYFGLAVAHVIVTARRNAAA